MAETAGTSDYWSKLLGLYQPLEPDFLSAVESQSPRARKLIFRVIGFLARALFKAEIYGLENIPEKGPYILACNHLSAVDYPFLVFGIEENKREEIYAIAKKYLFKRKILKFLTTLAAKAFPVDTEDDFLPALRVAAGLLRMKKAIFIAPEGTRSFDGKMGPFRVGVGVLAVELNVPIIPAVLKGTYEVMHRRTFLPHLAKVKIKFGSPIYMHAYQERKKNELAYYVYKEVTDELRNCMLKLQQELGGP